MHVSGRLLALVWLIGLLLLPSTAIAQTSRDGLTAFRSDAHLRQFLQSQREEPAYVPPPLPSPTAPQSPGVSIDYLAAMPEQQSSAIAEITLTGSRIEDPSITNTQEVGVDEGGIVKVRGDYLVVLRRGRLFTISTAEGGMRAIDSIDAYPPGVDADGDWYDEMLVSGDQIVVIGYSYERGGTEISRFRLSEDGRLTFHDAYHMRSDDYYSSRNYASRLIGDELIMYSPLDLAWDTDPLESLPGVRLWRGDKDAVFERIAGARQVFIAPQLRRSEDGEVETLHTVSRCNLTAPRLTCEATVVLGPEGRSFYVSSEAVYLWTSEGWRGWQENAREDAAESSLYRIPLDGSRPQAVMTRGSPMDQFSFREDRQRGVLEVVVFSEGGGDEMWRPAFTQGAAALLRLPLSRFGNGSREAPRRDYRFLDRFPGEDDALNRFVGDHLLLSTNIWDDGSGSLMVVPLRGGPSETFAFADHITRLEIIGRDALVVSGDDQVTFTTVDLSGRPRIADRYVAQAAGEAESRSHGFFYNPDRNSPDGASGTLGLPVQRSVDEGRENDLSGGSIDMLFLRREARQLSPYGELRARADSMADDNCVASCTDWYGNARPIFLRGRVFALLGYELVEGRIEAGGIREIARIDYTPASTVKNKD